MLNFLRDPAWQGIGVIISLVLGFIGFYYTGRNRLWLYLSSENQGEGYDNLKCLKLECPKVKVKLGSLIRKIANPENSKLDEVFEVGQEISYTSPIDGFLLLRMNDTQLGDNSGILLTRIEVKD